MSSSPLILRIAKPIWNRTFGPTVYDAQVRHMLQQGGHTKEEAVYDSESENERHAVDV